MMLSDVKYQIQCCGGAEIAEIQVLSGWLRIIKPFLGGYKVTRFNGNKQLTHPEIEVSETELSSLLNAS
jgi:hypothetical protein